MEIDKSKMDRARDGKAPSAYVPSSMSSLSVSGARSGPDVDLTPTYSRCGFLLGTCSLHPHTLCPTPALLPAYMPRRNSLRQVLSQVTPRLCKTMRVYACKWHVVMECWLLLQAGGVKRGGQGGPAQGHAAGQGQEGQRLPGQPARRGGDHPGASDLTHASTLRHTPGSSRAAGGLPRAPVSACACKGEHACMGVDESCMVFPLNACLHACAGRERRTALDNSHGVYEGE